VAVAARISPFEPRATINVGDGPVVCGYPDDLDDTAESAFLKAQGLTGRVRCVTDNLGVIRQMIQTHQAIGILPEHVCGALLVDRSLRATLLPRRLEIWLLVENHLKRNPASRVVIDWMRELFDEIAAN
jgi:DNA-binding transcriptional LysR family regulator